MRFLADENFNNEILRGLRRRIPSVEIVRVQDTEMEGYPDQQLLDWAAKHDYLILSHDVNTMRGYFYDRVKAELPVPGLFLVHGSQPIGAVIDSLALIVSASESSEWEGAIHFLPL